MREEGHYYIKRVAKLPKNGNANVLYAIRDSVLEEFFRWQPGGGYETITVGSGGANIQAGTNVTITGTGTAGDPFVINSTGGSLPDGFVSQDAGWWLEGSTSTNRYPVGNDSLDGTIYDPAFVGAPDTPAAPYGAETANSFVYGVNNKITSNFASWVLGDVNSTDPALDFTAEVNEETDAAKNCMGSSNEEVVD